MYYQIAIKDIFRNAKIELYNNMPLQMYHYTSQDGLEGILFGDSKPKIWFSRYDCLNDKTEGLDIYDIYLKVLDEIEVLADKEFVNELRKVKVYRQDYFYVIENDRLFKPFLDEYDTYVCSFSGNGDSLPMWNYYSKGDVSQGYNIGILPIMLDEYFEYLNGCGIKIAVGKVLYTDEQKSSLLKGIIQKLSEIYAGYNKNPKVIEYIYAEMCSFLVENRFFFKNNSYAYEEEIRIIICIPKKYNGRCKYISGEKKRVYKDIEIPYIEFELKEKHNISSVTLGPNNLPRDEKEEKEKMMILKLNANEYEHCNIRKSSIPMRY